MEGWPCAELVPQWKTERIPHRGMRRCFSLSEPEKGKKSLNAKSLRS